MRALPSLSPTLPLSRQGSLLFCLCAGGFELLAYAASDMVMPAMPAMVDEMGADALHVPLSLVLYLLGGVLVQWIAGPLSDDIGRRPVMLGGAVLFVLASLALSMAPDIVQFHAWRLLQGSCLGIVVAVAYPAVQEAFEQSQALRITALLANIALLSPLLAPLVGVALLTHMDWRTLFLWQTGLAMAVTAGLFLAMPETVGVTRGGQALIPRSRMSVEAIWRDYLALLRHRNFMACTVAIGLVGAPVVAWIALSPLLLMRHMGMDGWYYALLQLPVFGALISGNLFLFHLAGRRGLAGLLKLGTRPLAAGALIAGTAVLAPIDDAALVLFVTGLSVYCFGIGIVNTCLYRLALFTPDSGTGTCAAMLGTITVLLFCLCGMLFQFVGAAHQPAYFGACMAALGTVAVMVLLVVQRQLASTRQQQGDEA